MSALLHPSEYNLRRIRAQAASNRSFDMVQRMHVSGTDGEMTPRGMPAVDALPAQRTAIGVRHEALRVGREIRPL